MGYFCDIYKLRFGERFSYSIVCEPEAEDVMVPFLMLQPLVENAIVHGVEPVSRPVRLEVSVRLVDEAVEIRIKDDGAGCENISSAEGLGIQNVKERIWLHFGERASLELSSCPGLGTEVKVRLPVVRGGGVAR